MGASPARATWMALLAACCVAAATAHAPTGTHGGAAPPPPQVQVQDQVEFKLHLFSPSGPHATARCLDGSPAGFYYRPATDPSAADKWFIGLQGGGICTTREQCTGRSHTDLGSSANWNSTAPLAGPGSWPFLTNDTANPFHGWNLVEIPYCGGDLHSGQRETASNETWGLYFSGAVIVRQVIAELSTSAYGLNSTGNVLVFAGGSAGGVGVFYNVDSVAASLPHVRVVGVPVGGFPPEVFWYHGNRSTTPDSDLRTPAFKHHVALYDALLSERCTAALGSTYAYECGIPYVQYKYVQTPLFVVEALVDGVVTCAFEGVPCDAQGLLSKEVWQYFNLYALNATANMRNQIGNSTANGMFGAACLMHTGFGVKQPLIDGTSAPQATYDWVMAPAGSKPQSHFIDSCAPGKYPCSTSCPFPPSQQGGAAKSWMLGDVNDVWV